MPRLAYAPVMGISRLPSFPKIEPQANGAKVRKNLAPFTERVQFHHNRDTAFRRLVNRARAVPTADPNWSHSRGHSATVVLVGGRRTVEQADIRAPMYPLDAAAMQKQ